jgi:hypothetical protein
MIKSFIRNVRKVKEREVQLAREGVVRGRAYRSKRVSSFVFFGCSRYTPSSKTTEKITTQEKEYTEIIILIELVTLIAMRVKPCNTHFTQLTIS